VSLIKFELLRFLRFANVSKVLQITNAQFIYQLYILQVFTRLAQTRTRTFCLFSELLFTLAVASFALLIKIPQVNAIQIPVINFLRLIYFPC